MQFPPGGFTLRGVRGSHLSVTAITPISQATKSKLYSGSYAMLSMIQRKGFPQIWGVGEPPGPICRVYRDDARCDARRLRSLMDSVPCQKSRGLPGQSLPLLFFRAPRILALFPYLEGDMAMPMNLSHARMTMAGPGRMGR